jgi:hypothetical protein
VSEITASRTLVKSPPELWAECSDASSLARHLGEFGEIRITRLEPETAVAWEGGQFSGTVRLEPAGWGTKVVISARDETEPQPEVEITEAIGAVAPRVDTGPVTQPARTGRLSRLLEWFGLGPAPSQADPSPSPAPAGAAPEDEPPAAPAEPAVPSGPEQQLQTALDSLGQAHRRPFSRG